MIPLTIDEVRELAAGELRVQPWAEEVTGVAIDSRRVAEGDLFVAVRSGVDFVKHALARGAAAALVPDDAHAALAALGRAVRDRSSARVVAITGSTGKTSTKDILAALCRTSARTVWAEASYNAEIGLPLTLCRIERDTEVCITEMAMRGFGQIRALAEIARPEIGVVTNVGPVHLELVGSIEGVIRAKSELVEALPPGGVAIVPNDFPVAREDVEVVRVGAPAVEDDDARMRVDGVSFDFTARHQAQNAVFALAALDALALPRPDRVDVEFSRLRGEELELPGGITLINDCWNANPVSMRAALEHLVRRAGGRRTVAVLGDMAELGPGAPRYHREIGEAVRELGIDEVIAIGTLARGYVEAAGRGTHVASVSEGVRALEHALAPGDLVLVKASRAVGLEEIATDLQAVPV